MTNDQHRVDERIQPGASQDRARRDSKQPDNIDVQEPTGRMAVAKKEAAVPSSIGSDATLPVKANTSGLAGEKLDTFRPSHWLRPIQAKWPSLALRWASEARSLRVDVVSHDDDVVVRVDVAGISKDRLDVAVTADTLTIRSTSPEKGDNGSYHHRELPHGELERRIALPFEVQGDKASATVKNGLLEVVLPKSEKSRFQKITVN